MIDAGARLDALTIRTATEADVPALVALGCAQLAESYGAAVAGDPAALAETATALVTGPNRIVFVADGPAGVVGMIGLVRYPHPMSGVPTVGEVMWYVDPTARGMGLQLLRRAERWAAEGGAEVVQMIAPATEAGARVGRLYARRGYRALETTYQAPVTPAMTALTVVDDVLPTFPAYVAATRTQSFGPVEPSPGVVFPGIAPAVDDTLPHWIHARWPSLTPTLSFVRQSPAGQVEPNYIHTDLDMGAWTAIAYLTETPPEGDGTTFWRWRQTGAIQSTAHNADALLAEWTAQRDLDQWVPWHTVSARPNRVVLFPAAYFHSRAIADNYGDGVDARLIQVVFGTGAFPPAGGV